jgi:hypothetical protein
MSCLYLQGQTVSQISYQQEASSFYQLNPPQKEEERTLRFIREDSALQEEVKFTKYLIPFPSESFVLPHRRPVYILSIRKMQEHSFTCHFSMRRGEYLAAIERK